jgi:hypothetical protein
MQINIPETLSFAQNNAAGPSVWHISQGSELRSAASLGFLGAHLPPMLAERRIVAGWIWRLARWLPAASGQPHK